MNRKLQNAFDAEMTAAVELYRAGDLAQAIFHLETAHVLGQLYVMPHVATHYWMLKIGLKRRSVNEVVGQLIRIVLGVVGSAVGRVPVGNTGGTNISMFRRLPIDPRIKQLVE